MKYTDDYLAKLKLWAKAGRAQAVPYILDLPHFGSKKFSSYEELNTWKQTLLKAAIQKGGRAWKKSSSV